MAADKNSKVDAKAKAQAKKAPASVVAVKKIVQKPAQETEKGTSVVKTKKDGVKLLKVPVKFTYGTGKRKSAIAKVWLFAGSGQMQVNNLSSEDYFQSPLLIENASKPLEALALAGKYDAKVKVQGGGKVGQAEACKLGVARALLELNETFREKLREFGFLSRDPRVKERKKYGRKKARKGFQFRKR